jgi:S-adenosylmethionine:tRNA ribosyltransferase-isomerase
LAEPGRYQTVYAAEPGSAAAPTAGLHLTPDVLDRLAANGVDVARVELLVGLDTFKPVSVDDPLQHVIHSERYRVPAGVLERAASARRVVAVGTTSVRALESAATTGQLTGRTRLFIHQPYDWRVVDVMMTNFHLPRTTLLLMIDAFVGARWRRLYDTALAEGYRFLSFGDAMLLDRRAD